jgi:3-phenylpropionate/cinnamic acid dioxygenase small subunit
MTGANAALGRLAVGRGLDPRDQQAIEQFLYFEAALLDDRAFDEWYALLADDLRYVMPIRSTRSARDAAREETGDADVAYFDEGKASMGLRLRRLRTGSAWAEEPPSRTRHFVSNVRILPLGNGDAFEVVCAFLVHRNRAEAQTDLFVGERVDRIRRSPTLAGFQIYSRRIRLDQATLLANNISFFF